MEGGAKFFLGDVPFVMDIDGKINGTPFTVSGKGTVNSSIGILKGKWICTSGKLPMSWAAIAGTLGYGTKTFLKYPNGITHFFQECFPGGYSQDRIVTFENDGTLKGFHEVTLKKGVLTNKVNLNLEGFKSDSPVITKGLKVLLPVTEYTYPFENGIRSVVNQIFPLKNGEGHMFARQITVNKPLLNEVVQQPQYHHTDLEFMQYQDTDEEADHVYQEERAISYELKMFEK